MQSNFHLKIQKQKQPSEIRAGEIIPDSCIPYEKKESTGHKCKGNCKNCTCQHNK
ncbi:MAG: hypothetical protein K8S13_13495 [Desulfobacula sp.]|uniref:hypothetical protein n=1 Tax=Desulfobacula sp. TaxID=2593537 RepID=UPI0025C1E045|nr:hypothetical protein [Desulfobacula sp.]MCD4720854.1 hypothetical protein [Desulfobacula sp.]